MMTSSEQALQQAHVLPDVVMRNDEMHQRAASLSAAQTMFRPNCRPNRSLKASGNMQ